MNNHSGAYTLLKFFHDTGIIISWYGSSFDLTLEFISWSCFQWLKPDCNINKLIHLIASCVCVSLQLTLEILSRSLRSFTLAYRVALLSFLLSLKRIWSVKRLALVTEYTIKASSILVHKQYSISVNVQQNSCTNHNINFFIYTEIKTGQVKRTDKQILMQNKKKQNNFYCSSLHSL